MPARCHKTKPGVLGWCAMIAVAAICGLAFRAVGLSDTIRRKRRPRPPLRKV